MIAVGLATSASTMEVEGQDNFVYFDPHSPAEPQNLLLIDELESLSPILDFKVADVTNERKYLPSSLLLLLLIVALFQIPLNCLLCVVVVYVPHCVYCDMVSL